MYVFKVKAASVFGLFNFAQLINQKLLENSVEKEVKPIVKRKLDEFHFVDD